MYVIVAASLLLVITLATVITTIFEGAEPTASTMAPRFPELCDQSVDYRPDG